MVSPYVEFEVEREIDADQPWRDVFVNLRPRRAIQLRAGQFKMPFSLEQLTSATELDFVYRSGRPTCWRPDKPRALPFTDGLPAGCSATTPGCFAVTARAHASEPTQGPARRRRRG